MTEARTAVGTRFSCWTLVLAVAACASTEAPPVDDSVRVLAWNVSYDAFVRDPAAFRALVRKAQADILLLDEVAPSTNENELRDALVGLESDDKGDWNIDFGQSGGRQRGVIASRMLLERLPEFSDIVPYPEAERRRLYDRMVAADELRPNYSMDDGIPVNGAVVLAGERRLLVVTADLQSRDSDPGGWREDRRRVETREIRRRVRQVLERTTVDGIIVAGDFNAVSTPLPVVIASGPYPAPHHGLIAAELYHLDGWETWTNHPRAGSRFPPSVLDFLLYTPRALDLLEGYILDTEDLPAAELETMGIEPGTVSSLSSHRPLIAQFVWR
jgi:endonuclease/exonuclease/phosphatase family metal-dependent hydrolase